MDRICNAVHEKICALAPLGRYVIISLDEFFENFPDDAEKTEAELKKALRALVAAGLIDLRYSSGEMYCAAPLKKFEPQPEPQKETEPPTELLADDKEDGEISPPEPRKNSNRKNLWAFLFSMLGGFAGSLIGWLVFAVT